MKLSSKEIFTFLGCVVSIALVVFLILKLSIPKKIKQTIENIKDNNSEKEENETNKEEDEIIVIPNYITSDEAIGLGNDLYTKAETIYFDPLSYSGFIFRNSDRDEYDTKIVNFSAVASTIFKDINPLLSSDAFFDGNSLYIKNTIKIKDYTFLKTELLLNNIEEKRVTFTARSYYCERNNDRCNEEEQLMYSTKVDRQFIIEKINDNWIVTKFESAY